MNVLCLRISVVAVAILETPQYAVCDLGETAAATGNAPPEMTCFLYLIMFTLCLPTSPPPPSPHPHTLPSQTKNAWNSTLSEACFVLYFMVFA